MSLSDLAAIGTFISGMAVVITLVFLMQQIRQNTKALRSQAHFNATSLGQRPLEILLQDEGLAKIVHAGYAASDTVVGADWERFSTFCFMHFNAWEYGYYLNRDSSIHKELWNGADNYFKGLVHSKAGLAKFWEQWKTAFDEPFRSYVALEFSKTTKPN